MRRLTVFATLAMSLAVPTLRAESFADYARVRQVEPQYERVNSPREECWTETVSSQQPRESRRSTSGAIIGGVVGAALGHQVGKGRGKDAATAVGAIAGAMIGDRWNDRGGDEYETVSRDERRCRSVDQWDNRLTGYRVTYEYAGRRYTSFMPRDPGREVRVNVSVEPSR
ncbi:MULTISPECIES: glycine zipper 2TM domain-containing protein [Leeia]|uniref:Glycine zipper 2TM domain-containing protein n=1 Tax=Leeia aquatica TaxID=2725557 RepID=A0A847S5W9_9NEIS|nr:glycine zipper 2TM domain-containing protein [Leeia aquatica]NLR74195.1 glycine zipper 2TM domain-containing protein [Leeia aquatica]